ncbi:MAG: phosphatase PAP2 family protein [Acidobacteriota bacterium]
MDAALFAALNSAHTPALDALMRGASWLGYFPGLWFVVGAAALGWPRARAAAFRMCLAVALAYVVASGVVKPLVGRVRPSFTPSLAARVLEVQPHTSASFPSGHAATAVAGAMAGALIVPAATWPLWALAALVSYSRIYVGVHYPSDVIGGALLGAACAWFVLGGLHPSMRVRPPAPAGERHVA